MWMQMVRNPCQPQAHILCKFFHRTRVTIRNLGAWKDLRSSCWSRAIFVPPKNAKKLVPPANWIPQSVQTTNFSSHIFAEHVWSTAHSPRPPFLSSSHCRAPCVCPSNSTLSRASGSAGRSMPGGSPFCFWTVLYLHYLIPKKSCDSHHKSQLICDSWIIFGFAVIPSQRLMPHPTCCLRPSPPSGCSDTPDTIYKEESR